MSSFAAGHLEPGEDPDLLMELRRDICDDLGVRPLFFLCVLCRLELRVYAYSLDWPLGVVDLRSQVCRVAVHLILKKKNNLKGNGDRVANAGTYRWRRSHF